MKLMKNETKSLEDYLEAILILDLNKEPLEVTKIAKHLKVSKPAVTRALKILSKKGYINKTSYSAVEFTPKGLKLAKSIYHRHTTIYKFLLSIGLNKRIAEKDCCKIEHVISEETLRALEKLINK